MARWGMGEIVNLRGRRRQRDRQEAERQAADNRARFGRTRAEKARDAQEQARGEAILDGARIERDPAAAPAVAPAIEE